MVKTTKHRKSDKSKSPDAQLLSAADAGNHDAMKKALAQRADPNAKGRPHEANPLSGQSALMRCASRGDSEGVKLLLKAGADPDLLVRIGEMRHTTALHLAAENGHADIVPLLTRGGADVNANELSFGSREGTPLHLAAEHGHANVIQALLTARAELEKKGYEGRTPLHAAAGAGRPDTVKLLVKAGANVNARDADKWTPLFLACYQVNIVKESGRDFAEVGRVLLAAGANPHLGGRSSGMNSNPLA